MTNTVSTNAASTVLINLDYKTVRCEMDCYILHRVLLVIILLLIITFNLKHFLQNFDWFKGIAY